MKQLFIAVFALLVGINGAFAQSKNAPVFKFENGTTHDFGTIPEGPEVTHYFEFTNTGKEPLIIQNVSASCGCTTPEWSHDPIAPGASKKITVGYNAAANGKFEKAITVFYNSGKTKLLYIKGEVWQTPADPAPANASVQLLKNINH